MAPPPGSNSARRGEGDAGGTCSGETNATCTAYSMGDTAGFSELQWMEHAFGAVDSSAAAANRDDAENEDETLNDSITLEDILQNNNNHKKSAININTTCTSNASASILNESESRTLDEDSIEALLAHTDATRTRTSTAANAKAKAQESVAAQESDKQSKENDNLLEQKESSTTTQRHNKPSSTTGTSSTRTSNTRRIAGPNERIYVEHYQSAVQNRIQQHRRRHPNDLPFYKDMSPEEQRRQQQLVLSLLQRLKIAKTDGASDGANVSLNDNNDSLSQQMIDNDHNHNNDQDTSTSMLLLTPQPSNNNENNNNSSFHSTQSVEHARAAAASDFDSPASVATAAALRQKRLATTSGKRGADAARLRLLDHDSAAHSDQENEPSLLRSIGRLSLRDDDDPFPDNHNDVFTASQSPISQHLTHSPLRQPMDDHQNMSDDFGNNDQNYHNMESNNNFSFGADDSSMEVDGANHDSRYDSNSDDSSTNSNNKNKKQSSQRRDNNDTIVETSMMANKMVRWDFERQHAKEAPTDVRLAPGQIFQYSKLPVQTKKRPGGLPTQTFPDPFAYYDYNLKLKRRLNRLYQWILQRDQSSTVADFTAGAVLNIEFEQIVDVVLKLALEYPANGDDDDGNQQLNNNNNNALQGSALIVLRSKEDVETLSQAFREGSACAVLDHANLPLKDRKSPTTASKAAKFDVVLTTYDALKAPDATVKLDQQGHAVHRKETCRDGWYTSKSSASQSVASVAAAAAASSSSSDSDSDDDNDNSVAASGNALQAKNALAASTTTTNKQLSVLHKLVWRRVVFADQLGRKCFLAKSGTARVAAATALSARSRVAFFARDEDAKERIKGFKALKQSDKNALSSLTAVLRLAVVDGVATELRQNIVDFLDKPKVQQR